jgi:3-hydroxypropanoate dehydrogenase
MAPTGGNTQPMRVVFVRTPEGKARLLSHMFEGNVAKTESAPVTAILAVDRRFHEHIPTILPFRPEMKEVFEANPEMWEKAGSLSAALQAAYFILAARANGLAAGPHGRLRPGRPRRRLLSRRPTGVFPRREYRSPGRGPVVGPPTPA